MARLGGTSSDGSSPTLVITSPVDHASVSAGFMVSARASDETGLSAVSLYVDGMKAETRTVAPFDFTTDAALASGSHTVMTAKHATRTTT